MSEQTRRRSKFTTVNVQEVHSNVDQEIIEITTDKLRIILAEHLNGLESRSSWQAPLGILITILVVFSTTNFHDTLSLKAETWSALFVLIGLISAGWLLRSLIRMGKSQSIDDFLNKVKNKT